jgi:predicted nucleotidyltransferase
MTQVSQGGLAIANHIAAAYRENPNVLVVMVSGSVARGHADTYSDLEIGVFWAHPPSDAERKTAIARTGGEVWSFTSYETDPEVVAQEHF